MRARLRALKEELQRRMHEPIPRQGKWLRQVVRGYFAYHAVPTNGKSMSTFRHYVMDLWRRALQRRSQRDRSTWGKPNTRVTSRNVSGCREGVGQVSISQKRRKAHQRPSLGRSLADCHTENRLISYPRRKKRSCERRTGARYTTGEQIATKTAVYFAAGDTSVGFTPFRETTSVGLCACQGRLVGI